MRSPQRLTLKSPCSETMPHHRRMLTIEGWEVTEVVTKARHRRQNRKVRQPQDDSRSSDCAPTGGRPGIPYRTVEYHRALGRMRQRRHVVFRRGAGGAALPSGTLPKRRARAL